MTCQHCGQTLVTIDYEDPHGTVREGHYHLSSSTQRCPQEDLIRMNDVQIVREGVAIPSTEIVTCAVCGCEGLRGDFPGQGGIVPNEHGDLVCDECADNQEALLVGEGPRSDAADAAEKEA